jgi:molecular chaperone HscA
MVAGAARIRVSFQVDADGLLLVEAEELSSGVKSSVVVKPSFGLQESEIEKMIRDSHAQAGHDKEMRQLKENQVEALRIIEAIESALSIDGELLSSEERKMLEVGLRDLQESLSSDDADLIHDNSVKLNELSMEFAARRMDTQIKSAFAGKKLEEIDR